MNGFLEYVPGTSLMHRLNPVVKLIGAIVFAVACFFTSNLVFLACMLVLALVMAASCGMLRPTTGLMKAVFVFSLLLAIIQILFTPSGDVLVALPWGYIGTGSLIAALTTVIRLEAAALRRRKHHHTQDSYAMLPVLLPFRYQQERRSRRPSALL